MVRKLVVGLFTLLLMTSCAVNIVSHDMSSLDDEEALAAIAETTPLPTISIQTFQPVPVRVEAQMILSSPHEIAYEIGRSEEGRPIVLWRFGQGTHLISLVGGIHGRYEANTVELSNELTSYFSSNPEAISSGVTIDIIPVANPDGYALEDRNEGRFNSNGVDLNRNWGCDWSSTANFHNSLVNPGEESFSEAETRALADYAITQQPSAVVFYHSAADGIFSGGCEGIFSPAFLAETLSSAAGYPVGSFNSYPVNGDASNWMVQQGIPSVIVELSTSTSSEYGRNLEGVMALQCYFAAQDRENGIILNGLVEFLNEYCGI